MTDDWDMSEEEAAKSYDVLKHKKSFTVEDLRVACMHAYEGDGSIDYLCMACEYGKKKKQCPSGCGKDFYWRHFTLRSDK